MELQRSHLLPLFNGNTQQRPKATEIRVNPGVHRKNINDVEEKLLEAKGFIVYQHCLIKSYSATSVK